MLTKWTSIQYNTAKILREITTSPDSGKSMHMHTITPAVCTRPYFSRTHLLSVAFAKNTALGRRLIILTFWSATFLFMEELKAFEASTRKIASVSVLEKICLTAASIPATCSVHSWVDLAASSTSPLVTNRTALVKIFLTTSQIPFGQTNTWTLV